MFCPESLELFRRQSCLTVSFCPGDTFPFLASCHFAVTGMHGRGFAKDGQGENLCREGLPALVPVDFWVGVMACRFSLAGVRGESCVFGKGWDRWRLMTPSVSAEGTQRSANTEETSGPTKGEQKQGCCQDPGEDEGGKGEAPLPRATAGGDQTPPPLPWHMGIGESLQIGGSRVIGSSFWGLGPAQDKGEVRSEVLRLRLPRL